MSENRTDTLHPDLHDRTEWSASGAWRKGTTITLDDLKHGTGPIERITSAEWFESAAQRAPHSAPTSAAKRAPAKEWKAPIGRTMGFGKHKDRLMADAKEEDPRYWQWCLDEIPSFRAKAAAAGLLDEVDDSA